MNFKRILLFTIMLLLSACGASEPRSNNTINLMFLSDIPPSYERNIKEFAKAAVNDGNKEVNAVLYPISREKLTIEIVAKETDIFVIDASLKHILLDSYGLSPLDRLAGRFADDSLIEEYKLEDEDDGEKHLYAIPISNDSALLLELGLHLATPLIAVIVKQRPHQEQSMKILERFL